MESKRIGTVMVRRCGQGPAHKGTHIRLSSFDSVQQVMGDTEEF